MATFREQTTREAEKENSVGGLVALRKKLHDRLEKLVAGGSQDFDANVGSYGWKRIADERGQRAYSVLRERQLKDEEERTSRIRARRQALEVERNRAQFVASLPAPAKEFQPAPEIEKQVEVYDYNFNTLGITRIPVRRDVVQRTNPEKEVDARAAAVAYEEAKDSSGKVRATREAKLKARSRHQEALKKEKITQDYSSVIKELDRHQRAAAFLPRRKGPKIKKGDRSPTDIGGGQEKENIILEKAVERVMRETGVTGETVNSANVTLRKKKAARLSVGKQHSTKTTKGTLAVKQSALGSFFSRLRNERRLSTSLRSASSSSRSKAFFDTGASDLLDNSVRKTVQHKHVILPCSPLTLEDVEVQPAVVDRPAVAKRETTDSATQTRLSFHPNSLSGMTDQSSPSASSYYSLPSGFGQSPLAADVLRGNLSQSTQTPGDLVTMYQKYLLNRAKGVRAPSSTAMSTSQKSGEMLSEGRSTSSTTLSLSPDLSSYIKHLAKKHFLSPGDSESPSGTTSETVIPSSDSSGPVAENTNHDVEDLRLTRESISPAERARRRQGVHDVMCQLPLSHSQVAAVPVLSSRQYALRRSPPELLRSPAKAPGAPTKQRTNSEQKITARMVSQKTSFKTPAFRKETIPKIVVQEPSVTESDTSEQVVISLSPPVTLTLTSPESTLVVHLSGPEESTTKSSEASPTPIPATEHSAENKSLGDISRNVPEKPAWVPQPFIPIQVHDRVNPVQHTQEYDSRRPFFDSFIGKPKTGAPSPVSRFFREDSWLPDYRTSLSQRLPRAADRSEGSSAVEKPLEDGAQETPECSEVFSSLSNLPSQSPEEMESIMSMLLTKNDGWHMFRPRPPASLPLGYRQFAEPHELSTISEVDTPHTSVLKDVASWPRESDNIHVMLGSGLIERQKEAESSSSSSFVTLTPVSRVSNKSNNVTDAHVPLWEQILGSAEKSYSPRFLSKVGPKRIPSQSTPVKDDVGYVPEFEEGVLEHSFISLVGSELTIDDRRVPDVDQNLSATSAGDAWYTLTPHTPNRRSPLVANPTRGVAAAASLRKMSVTDSVASFLRHELSCANVTDGSECQ